MSNRNNDLETPFTFCDKMMLVLAAVIVAALVTAICIRAVNHPAAEHRGQVKVAKTK